MPSYISLISVLAYLLIHSLTNSLINGGMGNRSKAKSVLIKLSPTTIMRTTLLALMIMIILTISRV